MQSLGETLSTARNEKGYTIDQVAHETNISRNYIQQLEGELYDQFPAEAYLIGFLRNYSEYLGLDPEKMITLYRNHKLSEEPSPIEELVGKRHKSGRLPLIVIGGLVIAALLILAGIKVVPQIQASMEEKRLEREEEENRRSPVNHMVELEESQFRIMQGDSISFSLEGQSFHFSVIDASNHFRLEQKDAIAGEEQQYNLRLNEELFISLYRDTPDYRLILEDYGLSTGEGILSIWKLAEPEEIETTEDDIPTLSEISEETPMPQGVVEPEIIMTLPSPERFTVDITFRGYCLYRYEHDNRERDERFYREGDNFRIDVNRKIKLWISNSGSAYTKVNGQEVILGTNGQVSVKSIQWIKNDQGSYDLVLLPVY